MNSMIVQQASTFLNAVVSQMSGQSGLAAINNFSDVVSVAETLLQTGRDSVLNAISQVWRNTIFAVREYDLPNSTLRMTASRYGNATRKLSPVANAAEDDPSWDWPATYDAGQTPPIGDGQSIDCFKIKKSKVLQTNFYGSSVYHMPYTIFLDQFDVAFSSADELVRFNQMCVTERLNDRKRYEEAKSQALQVNFIAGLLDEGNTDRIVHALTEYNTLTGLTLTSTTVFQPGNFEGFIRWLYSRIKTIVGLMNHSSDKYQTVIGTLPILRHTSPENVRVALFRPFLEMINSMVLSGLYHNDLMRLPTYEAVDFWQSIDTPQGINAKPVYTDTSGNQKIASSAVSNSTVIGLIHDRDAIGYSWLNPHTLVSPLNSAGQYYNEDYHARFATLSDNTEKAVVICLD